MSSDMNRYSLNWVEIKSAIGVEGAKSLSVYLLAFFLLAVGFAVSLWTWPTQGRNPVPLRPFWLLFALAFGAVGWFLSRRVTKPWLRTYVVASLAVMSLLLITIGRSRNYETAVSEAGADARRLVQVVGDEQFPEARPSDDEAPAENGPGSEDPSSSDPSSEEQSAESGDQMISDGTARSVDAGFALLYRLCAEAGIEEECLHVTLERLSGEDASDEPDDVSEELQKELAVQDEPLDAFLRGADATELRCLTGWSLGAIDSWLDSASFDRQVVALRALASCELSAVDPAAETADGEPLDVVVVESLPTTVPETAPTDIDGEATVADGETEAAAESGGEEDPDGTAPPATVPGSEAVTEALRLQRSQVQVYEAVALGADEILSFLSGDAHFAQFRFSGIAWLMLLGVTLGWYRQLEIRAGERRLGPIDVLFEPVGGSSDGSEENGEVRRRPGTTLEAVFKESVIRNVPEPGLVPGSGALAPVGDLIADSDLPQRNIVSGLIEVAQTIFATKGGFTVTCSIREPGEGTGSSGEYAVFVRLRDTRTGEHLISNVVEDPDPTRASRLAGYWIAGWVMSRSAYVPRWAQWSESDAESFVDTGWTQGNGFSLVVTEPANDGDGNDDLKTVNALILAQRAYRIQTGAVGGADSFMALENFARAVRRQPRYPVARYRRGVVLGTMVLNERSIRATSESEDADANEARPNNDPGAQAGEVGPGPSTSTAAPQLTAKRLEYLFGDLVLGENSIEIDQLRKWCADLKDGDEFDPRMRLKLLECAATWALENRIALRWSVLARLRPSERFFWESFSQRPLSKDWGARQPPGKDWGHVLDLERCICAERLHVQRLRIVRIAGGTDDEFKEVRRSIQQGKDPTLAEIRASAEDGVGAEFEELRDGIEVRAREPDSHWQLSYNLGCFYAIRALRYEGSVPNEPPSAEMIGMLDESMSWLVRALDRPWSAQLVREWIDRDGDLSPLRDQPEHDTWSNRVDFTTWANRVPPLPRGESPDDTPSSG